MNTKIIKLDINNKMYETITAKQGDTKSRFLLFNLLDGSIPFSLENRSVRVYAVKPDRTEVFNDLIITDAAKGYCILELTTQMLAVAGTVRLELMVIEEDKKLTSNIFYMDVKESINSEKAVVSTNEFTALMNGLAALSEYDIYKSNAKQVPGIKEEVSNLSSQLDNIANLTIDVKNPPLPLIGAKGDGVTNDTDNINAIIQYAKNNGGGKIYFPSGTYMIETAISNTTEKGIVIDGDNIHIELSDGAVLKAIPNQYPKYSILTFKDMKNGSVKGGKIIGDRIEHDYTSISGTHEFGFGVHIYSAENITVEKCYISDLTGDCIEIWGRNNPTDGYIPSKFITIKNCSLNMSRRNNISIVVGSDITISENIISNAGESDGVNDGTDPKSGVDIEGGSNPSRINVINNIFTNNLGGSVIVFNGNEVNISGNISDQTIMYQYSSNTNISNNILRNFKGTKRAGIEQTITSINPNTKGYMIPIGCKYEINSQQTFDFTSIGSPNNDIGTVFVTTGTGVLGDGDSITRILENISITGNQISGFTNGVATKGCTKKVTIMNNTLTSQTNNGIYSTGLCDIINNSLYNQAIGIRCAGKDINVIGNTIDVCNNRAIYCLNNGNGVVDGNSIINFTHNINGAIELATGAWEVKNNTIKSNLATNIGIAVSSENCLIINNLISGIYNLAGIRLTKKSNIIGNILEKCNTPNGIYCTTANGSSSKVYKNSIDLTKANAKGVTFSGGGSDVIIMDNIIQATNVTLGNAIDTSANTNSKLIKNTILSGNINTNSSDTESENIIS